MKSKIPIFNPRAKTSWSEDGTKFGQRMLEKMGWTLGQGLGANNQGITENLKIKWKMDNNGLGFKIQDNQAWNKVEEGFSKVLSELKKKSNDIKEYANEDINVNSLESTSQSAKSRVHYHKYTRGKDVSRYKQEDLAGILGKGWNNSASPLSLSVQNKSNVEDYEIDSNKNEEKMADDNTLHMSESEKLTLLPKKVKKKSNQVEEETNSVIAIEKELDNTEKINNIRKNKKRKYAESNDHNTRTDDNKGEKLDGYLDLEDEKQHPVTKKKKVKKQNVNDINTKQTVEKEQSNSENIYKRHKNKKRKRNESETHNDIIYNKIGEKMVVNLDLEYAKQNLVVKKNELKNNNGDSMNTECTIENETGSEEIDNERKNRKRKRNEDEESIEISNESKPNILKSAGKDDTVTCKEQSIILNKGEITSKRKKLKRRRAKKPKADSFFPMKKKTKVLNKFEKRTMKLEIKKKVVKNELKTSFKGSNIEEIRGYGN